MFFGGWQKLGKFATGLEKMTEQKIQIIFAEVFFQSDAVKRLSLDLSREL